MSLILEGGVPGSVCVALSSIFTINLQLGQYLSLGAVHVFPIVLIFINIQAQLGSPKTETTLLSMSVAFSPFFIGFISGHPQSSSIWPKLSLCFLIPYFDDALYTLLWFTCKAVPHFRILSVLSILESLEPDLISTRKHCRKQPSTPVRGPIEDSGRI